jgi:hypothetical protein
MKNRRVKWPHIATPQKNKQYPANAPTYSIQSILEPKADAGLIVEIQAAIDKATDESTASKVPTPPPSWEALPSGIIELRATAQDDWRRQVVDEAMELVEPVMTKQKFYAGCYCNVAIDIYLNTSYNKVCCSLLAVQFVKDGEPLSGGPGADELFKPIAVSGNSRPDPLD